MSQEYVAKSVRPGKVYDRNEHGAVLQAFYVDFQGPDGKVEQGCYWRRKQGNDPEVGQTYVGDIEEGQFGPRFKQAKGGPPGREVSSSGSGDYGKRNGKSPDQQASIVRQHSQEMGLRALEILCAHSLPGQEPLTTENLREAVLDWTDWFEQDANNASKAASGAESVGGPPTASLPTSSVPSQPPDAHGFSHYLEEGGVNAAAATLITNWVLSGELEDGALTASEQDAALDALRDPEKRSKAIERLRERYTAANGELPEEARPVEDDDDIPF